MNFQNAKYIVADGSLVDCEVQMDITGAWYPTTVKMGVSGDEYEDERSSLVQSILDAEASSPGTISVFVEDPNKDQQELDSTLASKLEQIDESASQHIETEFQSSALGSVHSYDCRKAVEQVNLPRAIRVAQRKGSSIPYMSKPNGQFFSMLQHTSSELEQVEDDMNDHIENHRSVARSKKNAAIEAHGNNDLTGIQAVDVTSWVMP